MVSTSFDAEVARALRYLVPPPVEVSFPDVTAPPQPTIAKDEVWSHIHEYGFVDRARDQYEREAAERVWRAWGAWAEERQGEWNGLLAPAAWSPEDLRLWAAWFKRQDAAERARWEARLQEDPLWWRRLAEAEPRWWEAVNAEQSAWLEKLLVEGRARRKKGFLGRLDAPDEAWGRWWDREGEERLAGLASAWQAHRAEVLGAVQKGSLKQEFVRQVAAGEARQLRELQALGLDANRYSFWLARIQVPTVTYAGWSEFQSFWAQFGAERAQALLAGPKVQAALRPARAAAPGDPVALSRSLAAPLAGLAASGSAIPPVPLLYASIAVALAQNPPPS